MNTHLYFRLREYSFHGRDQSAMPLIAAETKGRTYAELGILFQNKVSARKFSQTKIDNLTQGTEAVQKAQAAKIEQPKKIAAVQTPTSNWLCRRQSAERRLLFQASSQLKLSSKLILPKSST